MRNKIKKIISISMILTLSLSCVLLSGCKKTEDDQIQEKIASKVIAYRTDLEDSAETLTDNSRLKDYLENWTKSKNIDYSIDESGNIIMTIPSSEEYRDAPTSVILCNYDAKNFKALMDPMSVALYLAKNNENTGELRVIFTASNGIDFSGIKGLDPKWIPEDSNVFCLSDGDKQMWAFDSAMMTSYRFTKDIDWTAPEENKAYKITISGLKGGTPDSKISKYPNPVKELGGILADFKTSATIFELADIKGGSCANLYPDSAEMTLIIDNNYVDKFQKKIDKKIEKYLDKNLENNPDLQYTCEEVPMPEKVLTKDSQNTLVSSLYTLFNGTYERNNDDQTIALTNLGSISMDDNQFVINAMGTSLADDTMQAMNTDFENICSISGINFEKIGTEPMWQASDSSDFAYDLMDAFKEYSGANMEYRDMLQCSSAAFIKEKNKKCNIVNVALDKDKVERYTGTIITYIMSQTHTDKTED